MKKTNKPIKVIDPFSKQELTFTVSDELSRDKEKIHNSTFVQRKVAKVNESLRSLSPENRAFLHSLLDSK